MKTKHLIPQQLPEFIQADYPVFVEFLKAYYKWYEEEYSIGKLEDLVDIDDTIDAFLQHFRSQLDVYGAFQSVDDRLLLRNIKDLYTSKGSGESYNFFFKTVYGKESSVFLPWEVTLRPSEGKWQQDTATCVRVAQGNVESLLGNSVFIIDAAGARYKTDVKAITPRPGFNLYELIIDRFACGPVRFVRVESVDGSFVGDVVLTTGKAVVEKAGSGFEVGQLFRINSYGGSGTTIKVKSVNAEGGITAVQIIGFGYGYSSDFNVQITPVNSIKPTFLKNKITLNNLQYEAGEAVDMQHESGVVIKHNYSNLTQKYMDPTYVGGVVGEIQTQESIIYYEADYAQLKFSVACVYRYPGYYLSSDNIVGDQAFIHDSYYYQIYSYETAVEENLKRYGQLLRSTLHPAGSEHFGKYLIANQFQLAPSGELSLNVVQKPGGSIRDFAAARDAIPSFDVDKYIQDASVVTTAGGVYVYAIGNDGLLYVEMYPQQYWLPGYLEGEISFAS